MKRRYQPVDEQRHAGLHANLQHVACADVFGEGFGMRLVESEVGERDLYSARRVEVGADVDQLLDQRRGSSIWLACNALTGSNQHLDGSSGGSNFGILAKCIVGDRVGCGDPRADP